MFIGYNEEHSSDTYRLYILATKRVVKARDVLWLNTQYQPSDGIAPDIDPDVDTDQWIEDKQTNDKE